MLAVMSAWGGSWDLTRRELLAVNIRPKCQVGSYHERLKVNALGLFCFVPSVSEIACYSGIK
jgi:hypothetical protein